MFTDLDAAESSVRLDDSAAEISSLVDYCYGGDQFMVNSNNLLSCSRVAHEYDMPGLQRAVEALVKQLELTEDNVPDCIVDAHGHPSLDKLRERCVNYAAVHLQRLLILRYTRLQVPLARCVAYYGMGQDTSSVLWPGYRSTDLPHDQTSCCTCLLTFIGTHVAGPSAGRMMNSPQTG
jgi:hypothetical protein